MAAYVGQIEVIRANQVSYGGPPGAFVAAYPEVPIICVFAACNIDSGVTVKVLSSSLTLWSCAMMPFTSRQKKQKDSFGFGFSWWCASDSNGFADALHRAIEDGQSVEVVLEFTGTPADGREVQGRTSSVLSCSVSSISSATHIDGKESVKPSEKLFA